jgi:type IV pilus assembly protein PilF
MNKKAYKTLLSGLLLSLMLLSGCSSSQPDDTDSASNARKAAESNTQLGLEYMNRGQLEVSLGKLKKAVKDDPTYAPGHTVLGVLYERLGETELAGKSYLKAVQADPTNGDVNNNYGVYLCKTGKEQQAIPHFLKALDDPFYRSPAAAMANAGSCAISIDKLDDADNYLRTALQYDPRFPDALLSMANLKYRQNNELSGRAFLQRYEAVTPQTAESLFLGYEIETALRDDKTARQYLSLLNSKFPDSKEAEEARRIVRP